MHHTENNFNIKILNTYPYISQRKHNKKTDYVDLEDVEKYIAPNYG